MKSFSNSKPDAFFPLGNGKWHYNYNIENKADEDNGSIVFEYDSVTLAGAPTYPKVVNALVEERYTKDSEIALINNYIEAQAAKAGQKDSRKVKYHEYREFVLAVKQTVKADCEAYGIPLE